MNLIKTNKFRGYLKVWAAPISLLIFLFLFGALGYRFTEGWDWGDCLWMVLITITTIGFGEVEVLSSAGRVITFLIIGGGLFVVQLTLQRFIQLSELGYFIKLEELRLRRLIRRMKNHVIICGYGRTGKEIAEQLNEIKVTPDIYLCCVGGGGLIAGSSFYLKRNFSNIDNYSVEPEDFNDTLLSLRQNDIVSNKSSSSSICDALLAPQPGKITFEINQSTLKKGLDVRDQEVRKTIKILAETLKLMVEPGGAVAAAALLSKKIEVKNKNIVVMLSGGNIDRELFSQIVTKDYE